MKNLSRHTDLFDFVTSWLIRGIQMGGKSELVWLMGLAKHAIWATFCISVPAVTSNFQNLGFIPVYPLNPIVGKLG
jgi:hypothetical protein